MNFVYVEPTIMISSANTYYCPTHLVRLNQSIFSIYYQYRCVCVWYRMYLPYMCSCYIYLLFRIM